MKRIVTFALMIVMLATMMLAVVACQEQTPAIGVQSGTTGQYFVDGDADWGFDGIEGYVSKGYSNGGLAVTDMKKQ